MIEQKQSAMVPTVKSGRVMVPGLPSKPDAVVTRPEATQLEAAIDTTTISETNDHSLPQNWSNPRRWLIVIVLAMMSLTVNMSLVICAPATAVIEQEFNDYDGFISVFYITVPHLGQAISPLYIGPLSERIGRVPVCHIFNLLFLIFTMSTGFSHSFAMIVAFRFLAGASIASICLNPAITGDLFPVEKRGSAMSITSMIPILGSAIAPIAGGYLTEYLNWRWTFWMMAIITSGVSLIMVVVLKETYLPILRRRKLKETSSNQEKKRTPPKYFKGWNSVTLKSLALLVVRPFIILGTSRIAVLLGLYLAIIFAYLSLLTATLATVFQEVYNFSESQSGLVYIPLTIGILGGALMCRFTLDYFLKRGLSRRKRDDAVPCAENRLIPIIPAMVAFPLGLIIYGWSLEKRLHWVVPMLATVLCGFSLSSSTTPIINFLVDIFGDRSASAVAAVLPLRYIAGAFLPAAAPYMYSRLGFGWGNSFLAFVLLVVIPIPLQFIIQSQKAQARVEIIPNISVTGTE